MSGGVHQVLRAEKHSNEAENAPLEGANNKNNKDLSDCSDPGKWFKGTWTCGNKRFKWYLFKPSIEYISLFWKFHFEEVSHLNYV